MLEQIALFTLMFLVLVILATINIKRIDSFLIALLVVLTPFSVASFMPREVLGVTGLNVFNILWLANFVLVVLGIVVSRKRTDSLIYFSGPVVLFLAAYLISILWAIVDIESYPHTGRVGVTLKSLLIEDLAKPMQLVIAGWMVYIYCRYTKNKSLIEASILTAAIGWGVMITFYFTQGGGDIYIARDSVTDSTAMHANSMAALAVYFLTFSMAIKPKSKFLICLRYLAIACSMLGIVFTFSRIAYLTTVVIFILLLYRLSNKEKVMALFTGVVIVLVFSVHIIERLSYRLDSGDLNQVSAGRIDKLWLPLLTEVQKRPLAGNGRYAILKSEAYKYKTWGRISIDSPHSAYIEILIDMGLIGSGLLLYVLYTFYVCGKQVESGLQYLVVAMLCLSLTGHSFYPYLANYLIWIVYGISASSRTSGLSTRELAIKHRMA